MSILDVTEDQIFHTLGRGRDPNFKPIEKVRPVLERPKKTYSINKTIRSATPALKNVQPQPVQAAAEPITSAAPQVDDSLRKLTEDLNELNNRVAGIQKMVKWYVVPQFVVVLALVLALIVKS
jgi:hypothetical protein